jgi:hypothetical protein
VIAGLDPAGWHSVGIQRFMGMKGALEASGV